VPEGWAPHPSYWAVACDYASGRRVPFGREDAPEAELGPAVAASCAIPGFYHPVTIAGHRYVDGGVRSPSNLDLLAGRELDLVICLNPTSTREPASGGVVDRLVGAQRSASGRRLGREAKRLEAEGTEVVLVQPVAEDLVVMGRNLMSGKRRNEVMKTAEGTVAEQLREPATAEALRDLPAGEPHKLRRPDGPPSSWPPIVPTRERAGAAT
jgi:NTE family protein